MQIFQGINWFLSFKSANSLLLSARSQWSSQVSTLDEILIVIYLKLELNFNAGNNKISNFLRLQQLRCIYFAKKDSNHHLNSFPGTRACSRHVRTNIYSCWRQKLVDYFARIFTANRLLPDFIVTLALKLLNCERIQSWEKTSFYWKHDFTWCSSDATCCDENTVSFTCFNEFLVASRITDGK